MTELLEDPGTPIAPPDPPLIAYRAALKRYDGARLVEIHASLGGADLGGKPARLPDAIADRLSEHRVSERVVANLSFGSRAALGLIALAEANAWPASGLALGLTCLGIEFEPAILRLLESGLVAARMADPFESVVDYERAIGPRLAATTLLAHPSASNAARTLMPEGEPPPLAGPVRQVRESDGLEPILRLAAAWQRIVEGPIRQTQQGTFFKRDRERLEDDPVLAGPITDALEPLPDMTLLWIDLARAVGLVIPEPNSDRLIAAPPDFWAENAVHLPQMIATRWLSLRDWHEQAGMRSEGSPVDLALPFVRSSILLWLARVEEPGWVALDDLAEHLNQLAPGWDRALLSDTWKAQPEGGMATLAAVLLGPAYQLGLVRAAEETPIGRRVVQITPLGRYGLALGPPPAPRAAFDHFLMVQPNFEIIAYRQGLTPSLIGQFSRFARWSQVGAALELKLTPDSVYRGLEGGLTTEAILDRLSKHSARPLPAGVAEAVRTWADRRDRVTYYGSATLVEFASSEELEAAIGLWPSSVRVAPIRISDRLLLVEEEGAIPFNRFRMAGSRDYRKPAEACVDVEPDGVTLSLDLGRSDLLVDAELTRFADEPRTSTPPDGASSPRRSFVVTPASLSRAAENGLTAAQLSRWFEQRTGSALPSAIRLLLHAAGPKVEPFQAARPVVMEVPTPELLDGLLQYPTTGPLLGDRLGPNSVVIPDDAVDDLRRALRELGLKLGQIPPALPEPGPTDSRRR
ncbi:helicase-associated domain-containing protein [Tundrisphaera lichenicola]|uniref:helicase-associated domain-containing protein n=1 Tax=Tundrisphaera lichenicola TaxID=2029860 RepID=UPI003EBE3BCC